MAELSNLQADGNPGPEKSRESKASGQNETATLSWHDVHHVGAPRAGKQEKVEATEPFDANKAATELSQQMLQLSLLHFQGREGATAPSKEIVDKIHAELDGLWNQPEHMNQLVQAMKAQGASIDSDYMSNPFMQRPSIAIQLAPGTNKVFEFEDLRNEQNKVRISKLGNTWVQVGGSGYWQDFH